MANILNNTRIVTGLKITEISSEMLSSHTPIVFKGAVGDWDIVRLSKKSTSEAIGFLKESCNEKSALINVGHPGIDGRYFYSEDFKSLNYDTVRMKIDDALDLIASAGSDPENPSYYISSNAINSHFPGLSEYLTTVLPRNNKTSEVASPDVKIWVGTKSVATCHYDALDNIACVVAGKRRFTLFPPSQFKNLYFGPLELTPGGQAISLVDFENPDYNKHPRFKEAELVGEVAELEAGDAIYIPSMWMHHVEGLNNFNILINYWWNDAPLYTGSGMTALYHAMLTLREKPEHEKAGWKALFDYYIFNDSEHPCLSLPEDIQGILGPLTPQKARQLRSSIINKLNR